MTTKQPAFRKGDAVTLLTNWDRKGTVHIADLTVHSCGKRQMVLADAQGIKCEGQFFHPSGSLSGCYRVVARLSAAEAEAQALAMGAQVIAWERARLEHCLTTSNSPGYQAAIQSDLLALHEPRALRA